MKRLLTLLPILLLLISCTAENPAIAPINPSNDGVGNTVLVTDTGDADTIDDDIVNGVTEPKAITGLHVLAFNSDVSLTEGETSEEMYFTAECSEALDINDIDFVSGDESIAVAEYKETLGANCVFYTITAKGAGSTKIHFAVKNSSVRSEDITVTVTKPKAHEDYVQAFEQTDAVTSADTRQENVVSSTTSAVPSPTYSNEASSECTYVLNTSSKRFHYKDCKSVQAIKPKNYGELFGTREEAIAQGYKPCGNCKP